MFTFKEKETFASREEKVLAFWKEIGIIDQVDRSSHNKPLFSFYDGPPFATGLPHYGHLLAGTIKDVIPRYWRMKGFNVPCRVGWDCHGLPIENEIEKKLSLSGSGSIEAFGIAAFNEECRRIVLRYTKEWETTVHRMGRMVDFSKAYRTMDQPFMESVWWVFKELYDKGLIYEGFKVMPFSAALGTPLSNFEANLNYKEVDDPSVVVTFPLEEDPGVSVLAWTTTPWTLPSNLALIVNPKEEYVKIQDRETGAQFILAKKLAALHFQSYEEISCFLGEELIGKRYTPPFDYFAKAEAFRIVGDESVSMEEGTGVVHAAPAFGEVDFLVCSREGLPVVCPVDQNGRFTHEVPEFVGLFVKDADKEILRILKGKKRIVSHKQIHHRYPFCWRSDTPLIYKAVRTWFVSVEKLKERLLAANDQVFWVPSHIKTGRFGKWLENARDWAISRNRYWGTPIPIWRSEDGEILVIGSVGELEGFTKQKIGDLHRHYVDELVFEHKGKIFRRISEVFDCWFESGSMPYAQSHYPFEKTDSRMQADFIGEGLDQTRGWFYTLMVLSVALFDRPAFKHVIVNGIILAEDGMKMSKRLKNYPEPKEVIDLYGADAVRFYLLQSPAVIAEDLRFSSQGVEQVLRQMLIPLWNSYLFLKTYEEIYNIVPEEGLPKLTESIDLWIVSELQGVIGDVSCAVESYDLQKSVQPLISFIEKLTNWYIRRTRARFWSEIPSENRSQAFATLHHVLLTFVTVTAPFIPFLSEAIYQGLKKKGDPLSIHLRSFPEVQQERRNLQLEEEMADVQLLVSLGHALRKEHRLKVRQPLARAHIAVANNNRLVQLKREEELIKEELNVKELVFEQEESRLVHLEAKPNFRVLGKKVGPLMNAVHKIIQNLSAEQLAEFGQKGELELLVENQKILLTKEDITVERRVKEGLVASSSFGITIALETALSEELLREGVARELINKLNTLRKELKFAITDRIEIQIEATERIHSIFQEFESYIAHEVLAISVVFRPTNGEVLDINGEEVRVKVSLAHT